jgi:hypothetical protein
VTDGLVALYEFTEGSGSDVKDSSGQAPAADLKILDAAGVEWLPTGALRFKPFKTNVVSPDPVDDVSNPVLRIINACNQSNAFSIEAWVVPSNITASDDRIISFEANLSDRNFILIQRNSPEDRFGLFTAVKNAGNGQLQFSFDANAKSILVSQLQHVVATFSLAGQEALFYVDNKKQDSKQIPKTIASLSWLSQRKITLGNSNAQSGASYAWQGDMHLAAIYCKALSEKEVAQNFEAGANPLLAASQARPVSSW